MFIHMCMCMCMYISKLVVTAPRPPPPQVKCCGVDSYLDYVELFDNETVPESCCNKSTTAAPGTPECEFFRNVTNETLDGNYIYVEVCEGVSGGGCEGGRV